MGKRRIGSRVLGLFLSGVLLGGCASANPEYMGGSIDDAGNPIDGGAQLPGNVKCELVTPQSGCAAGQKCTTHDTVKTLCDPDGNVNRGERCKTQNLVDNCFAGNACAAAGPNIGMCRAFCHTNADCGSRSFCELPLGTSGLMMCTQSCNPIGIGAGCPPGMACYVFDSEHTDCRLPGTASEGQSCVKSDDCQGGLVCLGPAGAGKCLYVCAKGNDFDCPGSELCYDVQDNAQSLLWTTYGGCM